MRIKLAAGEIIEDLTEEQVKELILRLWIARIILPYECSVYREYMPDTGVFQLN